MPYEERTYRRSVASEGLVDFEVVVKETDLLISAEKDLSVLAEELVLEARAEIDSFIALAPHFRETLSPMEVPGTAPELVRKMAHAAHIANVGPMAAVAGAIADRVARGLAEHSSEVIVENGRDVYLVGREERVVAIQAGEESSFSGRIGMRIPPGLLPVSVCTSSSVPGPSLSLGRADAVTVMARDGALADAAATGLANRVREPEDVQRAVEAARHCPGVLGVLVIAGETLGAWGNVHLTAL